MRYLWFVILMVFLTTPRMGLSMSSSYSPSDFLVGANLWQAIIWAGSKDPQYQARLMRELDELKKNNISFVRVMASIQNHPSLFSIQEFCQKDINDNGQECLRGLKIVLDELHKRGMKAIVVFNNFWHWSGGFNSYMAWSQEDDYRAFGPHSNFLQMSFFFQRAAKFYSSKGANELYDNFIREFFNHFPQGHPAILSYQLANEPTPFFNQKDFYKWVKDKSDLIRSFDHKTPLSLGGVGEGPVSLGTKTDLEKVHYENKFEFLTVHLWPQNWLWYNPKKVTEKKFQKMLSKTRRYLHRHAELAKKLNSPLLLEEFGLARDLENLERGSSVSYRDRFFKFVIEELKFLKNEGHPIAGIAFWAWGGEGVPGETMVGDPPHEKQGWYSVFDDDESTLKILQEAAVKKVHQ
jgi:mannan endo-1,4-beta-mannosidase